MSMVYVNRLNSIRDELKACQNALIYALRDWNDALAKHDFGGLSKDKLRLTLEHLEDTFFVRLFAEFEGVLKDHLATNHRSVAFDDNKAKVDWLLAKILRGEKIRINPKLRGKFEAARDFRNRIAHKSPAMIAIVPFYTALEDLVRIVNRLPDPFDL